MLNLMQNNPTFKTVKLPGGQGTALFVRSKRVAEPQVHFAGNTSPHKALALGALVASLFTPLTAKAQEPAPQPPAAPNVQEPAKQAPAAPKSVVNSPEDMPELANLKEPLLVLKEGSVLSKDAQKQLLDLLTHLNKSGHGQLVVIEIPDTTRADLNQLATDIFNKLKIGGEGKNDGMMLLLNNAGLKKGVRGKQMFIKPGHGLKDKMTSQAATQLLIKNAVPHLKEGIQTGNFDKAVLSTVNALKQFMQDENPNGTVNDMKSKFKLTQNQKIAIAVAAIVLLILLIALIVKSGACSGKGGSGGCSGGSGGGCDGGNVFIIPCDSGSSSGCDGGGNACDGFDPSGCDAGGGGFSSGGGGGI